MSGMRDVAVLLTTYNRPTLVTNAIASVLAQDCDRWRLIVLDDGCSEQVRAALREALPTSAKWAMKAVAGGISCTNAENSIVWWQGPQRKMVDRKASIPYSLTINIALNHLLTDEQYVCYLCDDDVLHPMSMRLRAGCLDAHGEACVVYGRLRSVQFGADGLRNRWADSGVPEPLHADFELPTGKRVQQDNGNSWRTYYSADDRGISDPDTDLDYVEEGFWRPGPMRYGVDGQCDHNQAMHRVSCLADLDHGVTSPPEYWPEGIEYGVGDAGFFHKLASAGHAFYGVDCWAVSKAYHAKSDGVCSDTVRE